MSKGTKKKAALWRKLRDAETLQTYPPLGLVIDYWDRRTILRVTGLVHDLNGKLQARTQQDLLGGRIRFGVIVTFAGPMFDAKRHAWCEELLRTPCPGDNRRRRWRRRWER